MNYIKENYLKFIFLLLGTVFIALGASLLITANLGSDALTVLNQGVAVSLGLEIGYGVLINNLVLFIFVIIFNRKTIGVGSFVVVLLLGPAINLILNLELFKTSDLFIVNLLLNLIGILTASFGISLYMYSNTGLGPFEAVIDFFAKKLKLKFGFVKIILDILFFLLGSILGGRFGIGSIIAVILFGPTIDFICFLLNKTKILNSKSN